MKQYEAVVEAMKHNGGYATLGGLYEIVPSIPDCKWGTKTPFASIRRILQTHNNLFFRVEPGLWALVDKKNEVLNKLGLCIQEPRQRDQEFGHSYYQGLIIEIGNIKGYQTYIPKQDRNKKYLERTLGDTALLSEIPTFTYMPLVQRASMADVTWFNQRLMPSVFFEVEHSTDIYNSLLRFIEFQDFRSKFYIVASAVRKEEYKSKVAYSAFQPIKNMITFMDYESLSALHSRVIETSIIEKQLGL